MKRTIKLTESDLIKLVTRIIKEGRKPYKISDDLKKKRQERYDEIFKKVLSKVEQGEGVRNVLDKMNVNSSYFYKNMNPGQYEILRKAKVSRSQTYGHLKDLEKSLKTKSPWDKHDWEEKENRYDDYSDLDLNESCWKGYTQKGMKTMFGKKYPNCIKKKK